MDRTTGQRRRWRMAAAVGSAAVIAILAVAGCAAPGSSGDRGAVSGSGATSQPGATSRTGSDAASHTDAPRPATASPVLSDRGASLAERLAGRSFVSTAVTGHRLAAGTEIHLRFAAGGRLSWSAGCNSMGAAAAWHGSTVSVAQVMSTEMGCAAPLMAQDEWFTGLLKSGAQVALNGDELTLTGGGATARFVDDRIAHPARPLQGTTWVLDGIITGSDPHASISTVLHGIRATLRIADGRIHYFDGLNDYDGPTGPGAALSVGPDTVTIHGEMAGSAVGCAGTCSVDMSVLAATFHYTVTGNRLTVRGIGSTAGHGLTFTAQGGPTSGGAPPTVSPAATVPPAATVSPAATVPPAATVSPGRPTMRPPIVSQGQITPLPTGSTPPPGRHDSVPPQPPTR